MLIVIIIVVIWILRKCSGLILIDETLRTVLFFTLNGPKNFYENKKSEIAKKRHITSSSKWVEGIHHMMLGKCISKNKGRILTFRSLGSEETLVFVLTKVLRNELGSCTPSINSFLFFLLFCIRIYLILGDFCIIIVTAPTLGT